MDFMPAILQNTLKIELNSLVDPEESLYSRPADWICASECVNTHTLEEVISTKAFAPVSCVTLSEHPSIDGTERSGSIPHLGVQSVYADPANFLPLQPPTTSSTIEAPGPCTHNADPSEPIYAEVYDKLSPGQSRPHRNQTQKGEMEKEPIYAEPVRKAEGVAMKNDKPDPFAHLYAQVCRPTPSPEKTIPFSASGSGLNTAIHSSDDGLSDVIYETLGII